MIKTKIINNGIDLTIFKPENKKRARQRLNLPSNTHILLFIANCLKTNPFKDYKTLECAFISLAKNNKFPKKTLLICIGEKNKEIKINNCKIIFLPYIISQHKIIQYYIAADIFIHATKGDNFPTTILESLACSIPVIGTNIGGIPEQINTQKNETVLLYKCKDSQNLAHQILLLLNNETRRYKME